VTAFPLVSVVLPFRDAGATLDDALRSIAAQTLQAFECVLIDDGSLDASAARAHAVASRDRRFHVLRSAGEGLVRALTTGIAAARTPFIARMDADDLAHPRRLERQLAALQRGADLSVISCLVECFHDTGIGGGMRRYEQWLNALRTPDAIRAAMFIESPIAHPSAMIRRAALESVGGYRDTGGPEDYDLWLRLLLRGHRAAKVPEVLLSWRDSPARLSRTDARYQRGRFFATKLEHFPSAVAPTTPIQICGGGRSGRHWARALGARGYTVRRLIDVAPRRWGRALHGVPVCAPAALDPADGFVLAAAGSLGAREQIESWLQQLGLRPWADYLSVA
jgi:glycosyltransferase involved in cell wall biosynthesis